ncbi:MAG TPA: META domain-containing protein [Methylomirabilota bacterium]|nr:META domain-containing protein [Methylomirabilota bacterium]
MRLLLSVAAVAILAVGCRTTDPSPPASLIGTSWRAEEIDGRAVLERVESTLTFDGAQRIVGQAACNRYFGALELGEGRIRLKPEGTTRMACPPPVMEQESRFLAALGAATGFRREAGKLLLLDDGGRVRVRLAPLGPGAQAPPPASSPTALRAYAFDCAGGPSFVMARAAASAGASEAIDLVLPDRHHRLPRLPAASGIRHADRGVSVWNKGREAILDLDGRVYRCLENRPRSIREDARARGVEFRASGNEPGWTWELLPDGMVFVGGYGTQRVATPRPSRQSSATRGETVHAAVTETHRLTVRIRDNTCVDSMSGDRYASTVEVELDGKAYRGCGDPLR